MPERLALRVEAFDLLRGVCALAVATYHMLRWAKLGDIHTLGLYGVYIFFLLSGASMTIAYADKLQSGASLVQYLSLRFTRLAPLYALACLWSLLLSLFMDASPAISWASLFLNVTFLFGLGESGAVAIVVGGWSLGIEFLFYLVFPLVVALVRTRLSTLIVVLAVVTQVAHVNLTLNDDLTTDWVHYIHLSSFIGYFVVGTTIGLARLRLTVRPSHWYWLVWVACLVVLGFGSGRTDIETLRGVRGFFLMSVCFVLVWASSRVDMPRPLLRVAGLFGEASYGLYLLHPIVFTILSSRRLFKAYSESSPVVFLIVCVAVSFGAAIMLWRLFERPFVSRVKAKFATTGQSP